MGIQERREREREARRRLILDAARTLVRTEGFNGATTRKIAEACELSEATLFFYFKSKDEIFTSLLFEGIDFMAVRLEAIAARRLAPRGKPAALWPLFTEIHEEHPEYFHIFAYLAHPQSTASVSDEVKAEIARRSGDNFRRLSVLLSEAGVAGDGRVAADLFWGAFVGLMLLRDSRANLDSGVHPDGRDLRAALGLLLDGIRA